MAETVLALTYNGQLIPHVGDVQIRRTYAQTTITCDLLIEAAPTSMATTETSLADTLTAYNKACTITFGGGTLYTINSMLARPSLEKGEGAFSGEAARLYRWSCTFEEPADNSAEFVREATITLSYDPARKREVRVNAIITADPTGGTTATANALANGPTFAENTINTMLGGSAFDDFDVVNENVETRDGETDSICTWVGVYREQFENDTAGAKSAVIIDTVMNLSIDVPQEIGLPIVSEGASLGAQGAQAGQADQSTAPAGGGGGGEVVTATLARPEATVTATYASSIDVPAGWTTDAAIMNLYKSSIRPHLLSRIDALLQVSGSGVANIPGAVRSESFRLSRTAGTIFGQIVLSAPASASEVIEFDETLSVVRDENEIYDMLWDGVDHTYAVWGIGAVEEATQVTRITRVNGTPPTPPKLGEPWRQLQDKMDREVKQLGSPGVALGSTGGAATTQLRFTNTWTRRYRRVEVSRYTGGVITQGGRPQQGQGDDEGVLVRIDGNEAVVQGLG